MALLFGRFDGDQQRMLRDLQARSRGEGLRAHSVLARRLAANRGEAGRAAGGAADAGVGPALAQRNAQLALAQAQGTAQADAAQQADAEQERATAQLFKLREIQKQQKLGDIGRVLQAGGTLIQQGQKAFGEGADPAARSATALPQQQQPEEGFDLAKMLQSGAALGAFFSDERTKDDVTDVDRKKIDAFIKSLKPKSYRYKPEFGGEKRTGIVAQDLERTDIGKELLEQDKQTGMRKVKGESVLSALLASTGRLGKRIDELEGKGG